MDRVPGYAWLMILAAVVVVLVASAVPIAPAEVLARTLGQGASHFTEATNPDLWRVLCHVAGAGALVVSGLLLLLSYNRKRLYILFWVGGWLFLAASMFLGAAEVRTLAGAVAFGVSQFFGIVSALFFVVAFDAYPARPRVRRGYALVLLAILFWFALAPISLGTWAVFVPGHILIAGALATAGAGHLLLFRPKHKRVGPLVVGVSMVFIAGSHMWTVLFVGSMGVPGLAGTTNPLGFSLVMYLIAALGMQLMTFEHMTYELRRTNRRLEKAQGKLRKMAINDALTGCHNRRFFEEIIGRELQSHRRYGIPMSILFVDVDRLKAINDTLGHETGDRVLQAVAKFLRDNIRQADYVFRWGGDEFLIVLSCGEEEAHRRGVALQQDFVRYSTAAMLPSAVGLSIGSAEVAEATEDVMSVIKLADERMYDNKRAQRRHRVHAAHAVPARRTKAAR